MSDLQPRGIEINIGGVERHFLFTFAVVDEIQDHYDLPLSKVIERLGDERELYKTAGFIVTTLINDEIVRTNKGRGKELMQVMRELDLSMTKRIVKTILQAYGASLPEDLDDEDDEELEDMDPDQLNIARILHLGTSKLGYSEAEVFAMTPRKFFRLYEEYLELNGIKKNSGGGSISDLP